MGLRTYLEPNLSQARETNCGSAYMPLAFKSERVRKLNPAVPDPEQRQDPPNAVAACPKAHLTPLDHPGHEHARHLRLVPRPVISIFLGAGVVVAQRAMDQQHEEVRRVEVGDRRTEAAQ